MKQSTTASATRGRKAKASNGSSQNKTRGRSSGAAQTSSSATRSGSTERNGSATRRSSTTRSGSSARNGNKSNDQGDGSTRENRNAQARGLEKFFLDQLRDIYYAEQKITQSLPKMQEAATTEELQEAFEDHLHQTQRHVKRLEKAFAILGKKAEGEKCEAIEGIAREVESIILETEEGSMTRDAALIMAAQKVEHYEIATYGGLLQLAITMGEFDVAELLDRTLIEEEDTDALLTDIAECDINLMAEYESSHSFGDSGNYGKSGTAGTGEADEEGDVESGTEE